MHGNIFLNFKHNRKHQKYLVQLPKIPQLVGDIEILYSPKEFRSVLLQRIYSAKQRIYLVALYLEQDKGGREILEAIFHAKKTHPKLQVIILVDWHRAQRGRIGGISTKSTNANWYCCMAQAHIGVEVPIYGVPVHIREALGVLHLKGFIIDDQVIYSGASLNDVYLNQEDKYRYDRYQLIRNQMLADVMLNYIDNQLLTAAAVNRLDDPNRQKNINIKYNIRSLRQSLREANYYFQGNATLNELAITPLVGLGKQSLLNKTIHHLMCSAKNTLTLCTPYFNMPPILMRDLIGLLRQGKQVEIIVGDKIANDFYIPKEQPFNMIGVLPYLYEINLIHFLRRLQRYVDIGQLVVRLWKNGDNSYHLKGIWVDNKWQLITGNNFNPRAWRLDLENALLIHDPNQVLQYQWEYELSHIRIYTQRITHYTALQDISDYPLEVQKLIRRLRRIRIDRLISQIM